jgi:hypothetical protein
MNLACCLSPGALEKFSQDLCGIRDSVDQVSYSWCNTICLNEPYSLLAEYQEMKVIWSRSPVLSCPTSSLHQSIHSFQTQSTYHRPIRILRDPHNLDILMVRKRLCEVRGRIKCPALLVRQNPCRIRHKMRISVEQMLPNFLGISSAGWRELFELIFEDR